MAIGFLTGASAVLGGLRNAKIQGVQDGTKIVKPPKTVFGKLFGKLTGRTQAAELQKQIQAERQASPQLLNVSQNKQANMFQKSNVPVSGGLQFGAQTKQANVPTLALLGGVVIAVVYFITNSNKPRRRRY